MDDAVLTQLADLARLFNEIGIKPIICGGLGIYLCFHKREDKAQSMIRATNDIDLMVTKTQLTEIARAKAIAEILTGKLDYVVREDCKHFRFTKTPNQQLDILAQPMEGFKVQGDRVKFVRSKLHGCLTNEALFVDEGLRTIKLLDVFATSVRNDSVEVQVPSPTNLLILKLCAFDDRVQGAREDTERAQTHAFDIYVITMLTTRDDYLEGQEFLARHSHSEEIQRVISIVRGKFSSADKLGWQRVLETTSFYPDLNVQQKRNKLEEAKNRLVRWFTLPKRNHTGKGT